MVLWCSGIIRSGSTLQYNLAKDIVTETESGGYIHANMDIEGAIWRTAPLDEWWVNKCHLYQPRFMGPLVAKGQAKFVLIYRDLRDVIVSKMNFRKKTFGQIIGNFRKETVEREKRFLEEIPADMIYRSRYEDVIGDLETETRNIADHMGIVLKDKLVGKIARNNSLESVKKFTNKLNNMDARTRLGPGHIYTGTYGRWRELLSDKQVSIVEAVVGDWLVENGYELSES
jgi:hypothetical protein